MILVSFCLVQKVISYTVCETKSLVGLYLVHGLKRKSPHTSAQASGESRPNLPMVLANLHEKGIFSRTSTRRGGIWESPFQAYEKTGHAGSATEIAASLLLSRL